MAVGDTISYPDGMELTEIAAFIGIVEHGSFTRAATTLHLSQPAISRRIDLLEHDLDTRLFERLPGGARLTASGEAFLPFAQRILADVRDGTAAVHELDSGKLGTVSLAIVGTLASTTLLRRITSFREDYPTVRMTIRTANSHEVSQLVRTGIAQVGLRYFEDPSPGIDGVLVARERLVIVCAGESRLVPRGTHAAADLIGVPWVSFPVGAGSSGEPFARAMDQALATMGLADAERIEIDSLTAQKRLIEADFGIGMVLESAISEEVRLGTLHRLDMDGFRQSAPVYLVRRSGGDENGAIRQLISRIAGT